MAWALGCDLGSGGAHAGKRGGVAVVSPTRSPQPFRYAGGGGGGLGGACRGADRRDARRALDEDSASPARADFREDAAGSVSARTATSGDWLRDLPLKGLVLVPVSAIVKERGGEG